MWLKTITVATVSIGVISIGSSVPAFAGVALSPGETIYAGETVTINKPSGAPPWLGSGSVYIAIDTGKSGAGSHVENVQGTENGNSVTFTVPANLTLSSGTPVYFLINDILFPYFTPNYRWGVGSPPTVLSPGETIYAGETVTINKPSGSPPWLGSGSIYIAIDTGRSGAGSYVENVQGTENGNSVTFTLPANLSVSLGTPMYFLINDPLFPYFTPNYTWGGGPPTGNLPEVPFAGTLPVMGLSGLVIVAYIRRRRRAS